MSEYGLGTEALPGACGPSQSGRLQAGRPPLPLHRTGPLPPDRAIYGEQCERKNEQIPLSFPLLV